MKIPQEWGIFDAKNVIINIRRINMSEKKSVQKRSILLLAAIVLVVAAIICTCVLLLKPEDAKKPGQIIAPEITYEVLEQAEYNADFNERGFYMGEDAGGSGEVYVTVAAGQRSSGGYGIAVSQVEVVDEEVNIVVYESYPDPDSVVTMALTYPTVKVKLSRMPAKVTVTGVDGEIFEQH